jgi:outer membrane receptor for ferrienterochelin and colicins
MKLVFFQHIIKPEVQFETTTKKGNKYISGFGAYFETIDASRYSGKQALQTLYTFSQKEWTWKENKNTLIAGIRLDKRTDFALNFSPRVAYAYKPNNKLKLTASVGTGFKAPDFRHMYLNLANQQIGYTLVGNNILGEQLNRMQQQGLLNTSSDIRGFQNLPNLKPEYSVGVHIGASYTHNKTKASIGIFRNEIDNLIDVYTLDKVLKVNGGNIWSYRNINRVFTQGVEIDFQYNISKQIQFNAGYQYLIAKDKDIVDRINQGKAYYRDPSTLETRQVTQRDYFGLPNRSRNTYNVKLLFTDKSSKFNAYIRVLYRGQFGIETTNGKLIMSDSRDMIEGFYQVNISTAYTFNKNLQVQLGCENLTNYTNVLQMPNIAGRLFFLNINYNLNTQKNTKR